MRKIRIGSNFLKSKFVRLRIPPQSRTRSRVWPSELVESCASCEFCHISGLQWRTTLGSCTHWCWPGQSCCRGWDHPGSVTEPPEQPGWSYKYNFTLPLGIKTNPTIIFQVNDWRKGRDLSILDTGGFKYLAFSRNPNPVTQYVTDSEFLLYKKMCYI